MGAPWKGATRMPKRSKQEREPVHFAGYTINIGKNTNVARAYVDTRAAGDYGADPLGDGTFRMVPSGDIVDLAERCKRLERRK